VSCRHCGSTWEADPHGLHTFILSEVQVDGGHNPMPAKLVSASTLCRVCASKVKALFLPQQ
jgi:hypothetical protein